MTNPIKNSQQNTLVDNDLQSLHDRDFNLRIETMKRKIKNRDGQKRVLDSYLQRLYRTHSKTQILAF